VFTENDYIANSSRDNDMAERLKWGFYCGGCLCYYAAHSEVFVPAGHVGLLMDSHNHYLFAQPGMHNISSCFTRVEGRPLSLRALIEHGDRTVVTVEQGYIGYCTDNGTPVLLPQGVHTWRSDSLSFERSVPLSDHVIELGPYTILTVDEGYAAVTQNNGKQMVLPGGHSHFLSHKNWKFEKFISTKIQTNDLDQILCTSADNIEMMITSTVNWRVKDVLLAATMAEGTMELSGVVSNANRSTNKIRRDVLKQCLASLAGLMGSVNFSNTFSAASASQASSTALNKSANQADAASSPDAMSDTLFTGKVLRTALEHANRVTSTYGVEVLSINVISATPRDLELQRALASGAVASAEALQAETLARGQARSQTIDTEAEKSRVIIAAKGVAEAEVITARGASEAEALRAAGALKAAVTIAESPVAVELAKMDRSAAMLNGGEKYFFGQEPSMLSNIFFAKKDE